ncbi:MAG TPA: MerR family transcriptional regulator [Candidatus Dormibacteraeota bacterium]|nr:MerR family transcriptional regulator [Candidatus Dormibacteraeota bacterium]
MQALPAVHSIGRLADLSGVPVKTIRFYSDAGLLPPAWRTGSRHRRYTDADLARLQLVRSLRELDVDLPTIRRLLARESDLGAVLAAHVRTVEAQVRALRRRLAVLRAAAASPSEATVRRVQALGRLDAADRRRLLEGFWDRVTEGVPMEPEVAAAFRAAGSPELPEDPTAEQLDAWLELAEMVADEDFRETTRRNAAWFWEAAGDRHDRSAAGAAYERALAVARAAVATGEGPDGALAAQALDLLAGAYAAVLGRDDGPEFRRWLAERFVEHTDPRADRYWRLVARVTGAAEWDGTTTAAAEWLMAALRYAAEPAAPA